MKKSEQTRQYIIEVAAPIFNTKGYAATSIADVLEQTGIAKGCLYGHFESKDELAECVLDYAFEKLSMAVRTNIAFLESNYEKLNSIIEFYKNYSVNPIIPGGCPLLNAATDADDQYSNLSKIAHRFMNRSLGAISHIIEQGILKGEFKSGLDSRREAEYIFATIEGGIMMAKLAHDVTILNNLLTKLIDYINLNYLVSRKLLKSKQNGYTRIKI